MVLGNRIARKSYSWSYSDFSLIYFKTLFLNIIIIINITAFIMCICHRNVKKTSCNNLSKVSRCIYFGVSFTLNMGRKFRGTRTPTENLHVC